MENIELINYSALKNCRDRLSAIIDSPLKDSEHKDVVTNKYNMQMIELKRALNDLKLAVGDISTSQHNNESFKITQLETEVRKYNRMK